MTVDDLTPAQREEVQSYFLLVDTKRRDFKDSGQPDRRLKAELVKPWRQAQPWTVHSVPAALRPSWTPSYIKGQSEQWRKARGL